MNNIKDDLYYSVFPRNGTGRYDMLPGKPSTTRGQAMMLIFNNWTVPMMQGGSKPSLFRDYIDAMTGQVREMHE